MAGGPMPGPIAGPQMIMQLLNAAQATGAVATGIELGVFAALDGGRHDAAALAEKIKCPVRSTRILLNVLTVLGLLERQGTQYGLAPAAAEHLVPGKPAYMGDAAGIIAGPMMWSSLANMTRAVRAGGSVLESHAETPEQPFWETFARSSGSMAMPAAAKLDGLLADFIGARPQVRVLDVAAGSGLYGFTLAKRPNVQVTALDWGNVIPETQAWARRVGVDPARVTYLPGNLFEVDWKGPYDVVILSQIFHHFDPEACQRLARKAAAAAAPGGRVVTQDFVDDDSLSNPGAVMFSMVMLNWTRKGEAYRAEDYKRWFTEAGLTAPTFHNTPGLPATWMLAEKR